MKKQPLLKKALKIVCVQKDKTLKQIAEELGLTKNVLEQVCQKKTDNRHPMLKKYLYDNLEIRVDLKIRAILNDMTFKEYCKANGITYADMVYGRVE